MYRNYYTNILQYRCNRDSALDTDYWSPEHNTTYIYIYYCLRLWNKSIVSLYDTKNDFHQYQLMCFCFCFFFLYTIHKLFMCALRETLVRVFKDHRHVKAFITHGGLMGVMEAVHFGVPMIGIPVFGDQQSNIANCVEKGVAIGLDHRRISTQKLIEGIRTIIADAG